MPTFPNATALTSSTVTTGTVFPCSESAARNEITASNLLVGLKIPSTATLTNPATWDNSLVTGGFPAESNLEVRLSLGGAGSNVLALQNTNNAGYSALTARDINNREKLAVGYGNPGSYDFFRNCSYIQAWSGTSGAQSPDEFFISQDYNPGSGFDFFKRFRIKTTGDVSIPQRVAGAAANPTDALLVETTGRVTVTNSVTEQNALAIRNTSTSGYSVLDCKDSSNNSRFFIGFANASASTAAGLAYFMTYNGGSAQDFSFGFFDSAYRERFRMKSTGQMRFVPLAADPSGAATGDVYYNSSINKLKVYTGSSKQLEP